MLFKTLASRAILLRTLKNAADNLKQTKRNAGHGVWSYRMPPPMPSKKTIYLAEGIGAVAWWWIFYHIFTEHEHVTEMKIVLGHLIIPLLLPVYASTMVVPWGEWPYVDPSTWTDEELGIPPDSVGPLKK